jgi:hypothetical protein
MWQIGLGNARSGVGHFDPHFPIAPLASKPDATRRRRVSESVLEQVAQDLAQSVRIGQGRQRRREVNLERQAGRR